MRRNARQRGTYALLLRFACVRTCEVMRPLPSLSIARNVAFASDLSLKGKPSFFAALDNSCEGGGQSREEEGVRVRVY